MGGLFVPKGWSTGERLLAVSGSSTISDIFLRMNSDIISFEFSSRIISSKLSLKLNPPFSQLFSRIAERSLSSVSQSFRGGAFHG